MGNLLKTQEEIEIITIFTKKGPQPHIFKWAGQKFKVEKINLVYDQKIGNNKLIYFSVSSQDNYFKLVFNTNNLKWYIEEVYHE